MLLFWLALGLALVAIAAWGVVLAIQAPLWIGIVASIVCVTAFLLVVIIRQVRAKLRASALETELLRQAAQQAESARPDRRIEVQRLQAQMKAAIDALKRTRLGARGGQAALYALPWYVIIGPPAAGKTTALTQSGLGFIAPPGSNSSKVRGTAGTRNCDWWFSPHAILLDTAGRLATGEDDRDEWLGFLDTLRKFRSRRPLDGVIVALSVEDLVSKSDLDLEEIAKTLRARADEVMNRLEMVLPLYVMLTKVDLIAGFVDFWGDLPKSARAQAWGASFGFEEELDDPAAAVSHEFELLERVLHARMLTRLGSEPLAEARTRILQFPLELAALRRPLAHFVSELCRANPYQETPLLRGFYFSSGTQTGLQLDHVLGNMARGFNLPAAGASPARTSAPQSYFVTELFERVIFPDRHLGIASFSRTRRRATRQLIQAGLTATVVLALVIPAALSYAQNSDLARATEKDAAEALALERTAADSPRSVSAVLDQLVRRVQLLERAEGELRVHGYLGPYAAPELLAGVKRLYLERLRSLVEGPVQAQLVGDVRGSADLVRMDSVNFQAAYDDLKLYLMLCKPEHLSPEWATSRLSKVWARALGSATESEEARLATHAQYYVEALKNDPSYAWRADAGVVSGAQGRLSSVPIEELRYGWLVDAAKGVPAIRPDKIFFGPAAQYFNAHNNVEVPGMYTALGWQKIRGLLESPDARLELEPWVIGQKLAIDIDTKQSGAQQLRELYFQRYIKAWSEFIAGLSVVAPTEMKTALEELQVLSASDGPYVRLFKVIAENVRLDVVPPQTLAEQALAKAKAAAAKKLPDAGLDDAGADGGAPPRPISPVELQFQPLLTFGFGEASAGKADAAPSKLSLYLAQLTTLAAALSQLAETKADPAQEFDTALSRTATSVLSLLGGLDPRTRMILEPLLMNPIRGSRAGVMNADFAALSDSWKTEVWEVYSTKLAPRYPFAEAPAEVSLAELADFFRPETGLLWKFVATNLAARLERSGNTFAPKAAAETLPFRPDFLQCLNVAAEITDALFGGAAAPTVPFGIRIHPAGSNIAEISLTIDGQVTVYRNEPERWITVQWPGAGNPKGAVLSVKGAGFTDEIPRMGDFGLFRLLEAGGLKAGALADGAQVLGGSWSLSRSGEAPVTLDVRPAKTIHPFARGFFRRLRCPPAVTSAVAGRP